MCWHPTPTFLLDSQVHRPWYQTTSPHLHTWCLHLALAIPNMNYAKRWTNNELAIVLYFSSRRIRSESVSLLLHRRGYNRTPIAAERKVDKIVSDCPSLRLFVEDSWDIDVVDRWPDDLLGDSEKVNCLISFTPEDAEIVAQVGH